MQIVKCSKYITEHSRYSSSHALRNYCSLIPRLLRSTHRAMSTNASCSPKNDIYVPATDPFRVSNEPKEGESLVYAALRVLYEPDAARKGLLTHRTADLWRAGKLSLHADHGLDMPPVPERPARDDTVSKQSTHQSVLLTISELPAMQECPRE